MPKYAVLERTLCDGRTHTTARGASHALASHAYASHTTTSHATSHATLTTLAKQLRNVSLHPIVIARESLVLGAIDLHRGEASYASSLDLVRLLIRIHLEDIQYLISDAFPMVL